jgi:hypothetical protein
VRLQGHGLIENTGGPDPGCPNAWRLTPRGEEAHLRHFHPGRRSRRDLCSIVGGVVL